MNFKIKYNLLAKLNNFLFIIIGIVIIILSIKYNQKSIIQKKIELTKIANNQDFQQTKNFILDNLISNYLNISHNVKPGENFNQILKNYNISSKEIEKIKSEINKFTKIQYLKVGTDLIISIKKNKEKNEIENLIFPISKTIKVIIDKDMNKEFYSKKIVTDLFVENVLAEGIIEESLYAAAVKEKVNPNIIIEFARIYGFEIDFQRDVRKGDTFQILYEKMVDENGEFYKTGEILYASMISQNREISLYKFNHEKLSGYYDVNGKSIEKALMKTPINGARLSSSFGLRKHPILGFNKLHKGTDFAAPTGTPIMASGTGTIVFAKWCGGGGNCIKIKHNSSYTTLYAHLSKFASYIKAGKKVKQGTIIGYVGSTGMSTGPHLHYEVHFNGKAINSQKLKLPSGRLLKNKERKDFEVQRIKTDILLAEMIESKN